MGMKISYMTKITEKVVLTRHISYSKLAFDFKRFVSKSGGKKSGSPQTRSKFFPTNFS